MFALPYLPFTIALITIMILLPVQSGALLFIETLRVCCLRFFLLRLKGNFLCLRNLLWRIPYDKVTLFSCRLVHSNEVNIYIVVS